MNLENLIPSRAFPKTIRQEAIQLAKVVGVSVTRKEGGSSLWKAKGRG